MKWVDEAMAHIGEKEVPGPASNPWIVSMWLKLRGGAWFWKAYGEDDSKLPWCGAFMAFCFDAAGIEYPKNYASAKAWLNWGTPLVSPIYGCVVVFSREGGGHVGLVVGTDTRCRLMVLGGNQRDGVCILPFEQSRVTGYRAPPGIESKPLPVIASTAASSTNEA